MGEVLQVPPRPDPEAVCTRVVCRVIEELSCIDIAPDSPAWTPLRHGDTEVGQLTVYRGRSGVARMVSLDVRVEQPFVDAHMVVVLTHPQSLVPHLLVCAYAEDARTRFYADLPPRLALRPNSAYADCCYGRLTAAYDQATADPRLRPAKTSEALRMQMTPWAIYAELAPDDLDAAAQCVDTYADHWARLMRQGTPLAALREARDDDPCRHDRELRCELFDGATSPFWQLVSARLDADAFDLVLRALRGE